MTDLWLALPLGFLLDQILGDPPTWPHPVRWIGTSIGALEAPLRRWCPERLGGILLVFLVAGGAGLVSWGLLAVAELAGDRGRMIAATLLIYSGLASRALARETQAVVNADHDLPEARRRLSKIVGRDTDDLPPVEIYRACIETVGENTTDGVVAPLFYAALAGPVGLWVYKAISTLDSMVGYKNPRYLRFGWAAARTDDLANWIPARLTWLLLALAALFGGGNGLGALRIGWRDGRDHPSPNSGWGEATMAGALGVQLGGPATYQGNPSLKPTLGDARKPIARATAQQAIRLMLLASWLAAALAWGVTLALTQWLRLPVNQPIWAHCLAMSFARDS